MEINRKLSDLRRLDELSAGTSYIHGIHSLIMLLVTFVYIVTLMSFDKYDLTGILMMFLYPVFMFRLAELSFSESLRKIRYVLPFILFMGIMNIFFDRDPYLVINGFRLSRGAVSFFTMTVKGFLAVEASYVLIATNSIYDICAALSMLRLPRILISLFLLTFRYITVMIEEVANMTEAYSLRAPGQKGLHISSWGSFLGQLLLRSYDKANELYLGMEARGYTGDLRNYDIGKPVLKDWIFLIVVSALIIICRLINVPVTIGNLIRR